MESSVIKNASLPGLRGPSPLLRLAPDERLIALIRRGQPAAFETLVGRYQTRLLAFCRHMLASREDAEDVLQEVFAAAFNAIQADAREINVRPWLYRIARNRCLNHLRRQTAIGVDSMDVHFADAGQSTVEKASGREDFRLLMADIQRLPETQKSALLLREMDALSYEQIAVAMETTVPGVKSLLVRARVSLGEAAEARKLTCAEVRLELGAIAEGISKTNAPVRRHVKDCQRCRDFRSHLKANNRVMAAALPIGPLLLLKKLALAKLGLSAGAGGGASGSAAAGAATAAGGAAGAAAGGAAGGGFVGTLAAGTLATKAVAGLAAAALVTAGAAVEVQHTPAHHHPQAVAAHVIRTRVIAPAVVASAPQPTTNERVAPLRPSAATVAAAAAKAEAKADAKATSGPIVAVAAPIVPAPAAVDTTTSTPLPPPPTVQEISSSSALPPQPAPATPATPSPTPPLVQVIVQATGTPPAPAPPTAPPVTTAPPASAPAPAPSPASAAPAAGGDDVVPGGTVLAGS
jgi:RNA polymerase sigma factor (sigma-70 family)